MGVNCITELTQCYCVPGKDGLSSGKVPPPEAMLWRKTREVAASAAASAELQVQLQDHGSHPDPHRDARHAPGPRPVAAQEKDEGHDERGHCQAEERLDEVHQAGAEST